MCWHARRAEQFPSELKEPEKSHTMDAPMDPVQVAEQMKL